MYTCLILLVALILGGCASTPPALKGDFADVTPRAVQGGGPPGSRPVRWGGSIVNTVPQKDQTCFIVVARPLDDTGRPEPGDKTLGRFIACAKGFYEPQVYAPHRELTVVGRLSGVETKDVGGYSYRYPKVLADTVHLWSKKSRANYPVYQFYPGPYSINSPYSYYYPYGGYYNGLLFEPNLMGPFPLYGSPLYGPFFGPLYPRGHPGPVHRRKEMAPRGRR